MARRNVECVEQAGGEAVPGHAPPAVRAGSRRSLNLRLPVEMATALGELLRDRGFTEDGLRSAGGAAGGATWWDTARVGLLRPPDDPRLDTLVRLFLLDGTASRADAERALAPLPADRLLDGGLLAPAADPDGGVRAAIRLTPSGDLLIGSDGPYDGPDQVPGPGPSAVTTAHLTVRRPVGAMLDLGTGGGFLALLAAAHCGTVTGTDVNGRALACARFNAALNGTPNAEWLEGSWGDPVRGRLFDLVVENPPYVISPETRLVFRDGGQPGDEVSRQAVRHVPRLLVVGGFATVMCNWTAASEDGRAPLDWAEGLGCDTLVLRYATERPEDYAARWNEDLRADPTRFRDTVGPWLESYKDLGIGAISSGAFLLRKAADGAPTWAVELRCSDGPSGPAGAHIERLFANRDFLVRADDAAILDAVLVPAEGFRLDQTVRFEDGGYVAERPLARAEPGVGAAVSIDPRAVHMALGLDGERPMRALAQHTADTLGEPVEAVGSVVVEGARDLLAQGAVTVRSRVTG